MGGCKMSNSCRGKSPHPPLYKTLTSTSSPKLHLTIHWLHYVENCFCQCLWRTLHINWLTAQDLFHVYQGIFIIQIKQLYFFHDLSPAAFWNIPESREIADCFYFLYNLTITIDLFMHRYAINTFRIHQPIPRKGIVIVQYSCIPRSLPKLCWLLFSSVRKNVFAFVT
jgi:hypothetical protein